MPFAVSTLELEASSLVPPAVALEVYTAAMGNGGLQGGRCSLRPTAGSEVATFGLKEEQVGAGLTFGTLALLFLMALPPPAHRVLEMAVKCIWLGPNRPLCP